MRSFTTKLIYNHLPTLHRQYKWKQSPSPTCPLCNRAKDDEEHMFQCSHVDMQTFRRQQLKKIRDELSEMGTSPFLQRHIMRILLQWTNGFSVPSIPVCESNSEACHAVNEQCTLGPLNMMKGVLVWRLGKAQQAYYTSQNTSDQKDQLGQEK